MKRALVIVAALVVVAGLMAYFFGWLPTVDSLQPSNPVVDSLPSDDPPAQRSVVALGRLEPAAGVLTVSGQVGDRVEELFVKEGDVVERGAVLARLEGFRLRSLEVELAQSQLEEAIARREAEDALAQAKVAAARLAREQADRPSYEVIAQREQVEMLKIGLEQARSDLQRLERLSEDVISPQELEHQRLLVRKQEAEGEAAQAKLEALEQAAAFRAQQAEADLKAAEASQRQILQAIPVESLEKQVALAKLQRDQSQVTAPIAGTVLKIFTQPGEFLAPKPLLQLANLKQMVCMAEVYETDVRHLHIGQPARIESRALDVGESSAPLYGEVATIGRMIITPELRSLDPFAPVDRHVIEVRVDLDEESTARAAQWVNLQVEVVFLQDDEAGELAHSPPAARRPMRDRL